MKVVIPLVVAITLTAAFVLLLGQQLRKKERAEAAKQRAEQRLTEKAAEIDTARVEASLRRAMARLSVADKIKRRRKL